MKKKYKLDYSKHAQYEKIHISPYRKVIANISFIRSMLVSFMFLIKGKQYPLNYSETEIAKLPEIYRSFISDGVVGLLDKSLADDLAYILSGKISYFRAILKPPSERRLRDCIMSFTVKTDQGLIEKIENEVLKNSVFKDLIGRYFNGGNASLKVALLHINSETDKRVLSHSPEDTFDDEMSLFHVDTNLNTLKCMIYLSDVDAAENGAFEYVKGSQKDYDFWSFLVRRVNRKTNSFERDPKSKSKLISLVSGFRIKNELTDFSKNSELAAYVAKNKTCFTSPNNIVLFDPLGIHRGGRVFNGERLALQLVFCCDNISWKIR